MKDFVCFALFAVKALSPNSFHKELLRKEGAVR
jgi:hypothetical protein